MTCLPSVHSPGLVDLTASNPAGENSVLKSAFTYISFVFAANVTSNTLSGYSMDPVSGSLAGISSAQGNLNGPRVLLIDPYGRYLYVLDQFSADIAIFSISPTSGNLTLLSSTTVGGAPKSAAMSSDGRFIYVLQSGNNAIASLTVDPKTGVPSLNPTTVATGNSPDTLVLHPNGHYLYASNNGAGTISSFAVDSSTGTLSSLEADVMTSTSPRGLAISPNGNFLYVASDEVSSIELFSIDPTTGQLNAMGTAASVTSSGTMFLAFEPSGKHLYATSPSPTTSAWAFAADPVGGTLQSPTSFYSSNGVFSLLVDSLGKFLYLSDTSNNQIASFIISSSVAPAPTTTAPTGSGPGAMVID
jgi:6-phosphogluconolactonase (cycloisomerase 2 family)